MGWSDTLLVLQWSLERERHSKSKVPQNSDTVCYILSIPGKSRGTHALRALR